MSFWGSVSRAAGQSIADELSKDRPSVGRRVTVVKGKNHQGKTGVVFWHGRDRFSDAFRYADSAMSACLQVRGCAGYRVGIETKEGERLFVRADYVSIDQ